MHVAVPPRGSMKEVLNAGLGQALSD